MEGEGLKDLLICKVGKYELRKHTIDGEVGGGHFRFFSPRRVYCVVNFVKRKKRQIKKAVKPGGTSEGRNHKEPNC